MFQRPANNLFEQEYVDVISMSEDLLLGLISAINSLLLALFMGRFSGYFIFLAAYFSFISCTGYKHAHTGRGNTLKRKQMHSLADFASRQLNVPYKWGGNTPKGFDCSGFTTYCFAHFGVKLPRTAADQAASGKKIRSARAKTGDLIFFKGADKKHKKTAHVGIVMSGRRKDIRFIHAGSKGITISSLNEEYFSKRFKTIRRVRSQE